jgi:hypothetical protein
VDDQIFGYRGLINLHGAVIAGITAVAESKSLSLGKHRRWDIDWILPTGYPHDDNQYATGFMIRPPLNLLVSSHNRHNST